MIFFMKCILMNKNVEVLVASYIESLKVFTKVYEVKNISYAPLIIFNDYSINKDITPALSEWFKRRGIPEWRDALDLLLGVISRGIIR